MTEKIPYIKNCFKGKFAAVKEWSLFDGEHGCVPVRVAGAKRNHWAISARALWLALALVLLCAFVVLRLQAKEFKCPPERHLFVGKPYAIEVCHVGGGELHSNMRLRVYAEDGSLLAQRQFTFLDVPGNLNHLLYQDTAIAFTDDDSDHSTLVAPKEHILQMPPTWSDWLSANVARVLWP